MGYSRELIAEVKELYPNTKEMHKLADDGNGFLGRYLDDSSGGGIAIETVLLATSLNELQDKARIEMRKVKLYRKWNVEYREVQR